MFRRCAKWLRKALVLSATASLVLVFVVACGNGQPTTTSNQNTTPVKIGISLSLTGDFSADGLAFQQGYQLWASDVNKNGGLLRRQVQPYIPSAPTTPHPVQPNHHTLFHVHLT